MERKESFDIYSWILSSEIRDWMRKKPPMPVLTQANIVFCAYRSVEDKLQAMTWLLSRAEEEEKEDLEQAAAYLRFVGRQITSGKNSGPGRWDRKEIWMARCRYHDYGCKDRDFTDTYLFYSYEEAKKWAEEYLDDPFFFCDLQKWLLGKEGPKELMECHLRRVGGELCVTNAWLDEKLSGVEVPCQIDYGRLPCRLPFLTGDLVKLDGPVFDEPVYGVWCDEPRYHEYNWIGRFKSHEERAMRYKEEDEDYPYTADSMERCRLDGAFELSIIDWLHPASEEELPKEQKKLAKIGRELRTMRKKSSREAEERFLNIFIDWRHQKKKS